MSSKLRMKTKRFRTIGIIPARMASTRFPGKPLVKICGIPMVGHVYFRSKMVDLLDEVYIATCDKEIAEYAVKIGCKFIMTSSMHERASDRVKEAMLEIERKTKKIVDIAVMIQGDEPMVYPEMIDQAVRPLLRDNTIDVVNLMSLIMSIEEQDDPNIVKVVTDINSQALYFSREPIPSRKKIIKKNTPMYKQIAIIPFRRDALIIFNSLKPTPLEIIESVDMLRFLEHGHKIKMVLTESKTHSVDTPADAKKVEILMKKDKLFLKYKKISGPHRYG